MSEKMSTAELVEVVEAGAAYVDENIEALKQMGVAQEMLNLLERQNEGLKLQLKDAKVAAYRKHMLKNNTLKWDNLSDFSKQSWRDEYMMNDEYFAKIYGAVEPKVERERAVLNMGDAPDATKRYRDNEGDLWWYDAERCAWTWGTKKYYYGGMLAVRSGCFPMTEVFEDEEGYEL